MDSKINTEDLNLFELFTDDGRKLAANASWFISDSKVKDHKATYQVHERNDKHTCVQEFRTAMPNLDKTIGKIVSIPVGWWVTPEEREYIVKCIKKGW